MASSEVRLPINGLVLRNLKGAMYRMSVEDMAGKIVGLTSVEEFVFVAVARQGLHIFKIEGSGTRRIGQVGDPGSNCYDVLASSQHLVYIREYENAFHICVHDLKSVVSRDTPKPVVTYRIQRRAPMALLSEVGLLVLGGEAWTKSWTTEAASGDDKGRKDVDESHVVVLDLSPLKVRSSWKAVTHSVSLLRTQSFRGRCMLGVADSRAGLKVYDMTRGADSKGGGKSATEFKVLYQVPVDEIRNFQLVGSDVAVFHRFEPNVSFWSMTERRTILCINIQDQMKELTDEFLEPDDDAGIFAADDDHVTAVTSVSLDDGDRLLVYVTVSGCVFGMSVANRIKLFNIPCPHAAGEESAARRSANGLAFMPSGRIAVGYEHCGFTVMDFSPENPPPRPPTRCQKRTV